MNQPPAIINGGTVVYWSWSDRIPFCEIKGQRIVGLAVCQQEDSHSVLRYACDADWKVYDELPFKDVEVAKVGKSPLYDINTVAWRIAPIPTE